MGICFSKADHEPLSFVGHNHPVGVAGLPKRELDHSPDHVLPQGGKWKSAECFNCFVFSKNNKWHGQKLKIQ